jgi:hypothetical protein
MYQSSVMVWDWLRKHFLPRWPPNCLWLQTLALIFDQQLLRRKKKKKKVTALAPCCEGVNRFHFTKLIVRFHRARKSLTGATA